MTTAESLTEREQQALEHMRKAQELRITLKEYASKFGLDLQQLYQLRKPLVRKGALGPARNPAKEARRAEKTSAFLPVRVVPSGVAPGRRAGDMPAGASEWTGCLSAAGSSSGDR